MFSLLNKIAGGIKKRDKGQTGKVDLEIYEFIFNSHLSLFNTRRDHEWRVIVNAMILMGAVDAALLTNHIKLSDRQQDLWWFALFLLFISIFWYQWGVQVRNRVDRVVMDQILHEICNGMHVNETSTIRVGIDRENENIKVPKADFILHHTYLWAFIPQMLVLLITVILSGCLPQVIIDTLDESSGAIPFISIGK